MELKAWMQRRLLLEFEPLLHRVLKDAYLDRDHLFYEDFLQELRLKLLTMATHFDGQALGEDRYRFTAYCRRGLLWYAQDLKAKFRNQAAPQADMTENALMDQSQPQISTTLQTFLQAAQDRLSPEDFLFVRLSGLADYSLQDLCRFFKCSRQALYQRRKRIAHRLSGLKDLLHSEG